MKKIIITVIVMAAIAAGVTAFYRNGANEIKFKTVPVASGSLKAAVTATGTVNAVTTVLVGTQVSGTIKQLHADFNSRVRKGQVIAEIDAATFQAQVDQAQANVLMARANVDKARATLTDSRRIRDRNRQLFERKLIAKSELDTAESGNESNEAQVSASLAQVAQAEASLRYSETNLRYTKIVSPVDGVVVSRNVDVGQTVAASFQTPTLFTIAQDLTKMQIDTNIDEADIGKIKAGQQVEFTVDAYPDNTFEGRVDTVRIAPITVQNVVTYDVVIRVDNNHMKLKPGMTANVSVVVASKENVLKVPNAALRFKPTEKDGVTPQASQTGPGAEGQRRKAGEQANAQAAVERPGGPPGQAFGPGRGGDRGGPGSGGRGGRPGGPTMRKEGGPVPRAYTVWILENKVPKRTPVVTGITDGAFTEVLSGGLKEGQSVIVESLQKTAKANPAGGPQQGMPRFR